MEAAGMRQDLPQGTVTFLFTDIEGSTALLHASGPERYGELLAHHHRVCRVAWAAHGGVEVDTTGDAFFVAFPMASAALAARRPHTRRGRSPDPTRRYPRRAHHLAKGSRPEQRRVDPGRAHDRNETARTSSPNPGDGGGISRHAAWMLTSRRGQRPPPPIARTRAHARGRPGRGYPPPSRWS
jgi:class 3 adenylate cyclase